MKRFIYIPFIVAAVLSMSSCANKELGFSSNDDWEIFRGYMQFSTDVFSGIDTRAELVEDMKGQTFGVRAYQYSTTTNWGAAKALAKPGITVGETKYFQDEVAVSCDASSGVCTYDVNSAEGDQLVPWDSYLYTFFAYQPYPEKDTDGNYITGTGISLSASTAVNTPTLTYTYGWLSGVANSATTPITAYNNPNIFDLMTAEAIDIDGRSPSVVSFDFNHRLFAIEVLANNYNENVYQYYRYLYTDKIDEDGNYVLDENGERVQIPIQNADGTYQYEEENGEKLVFDSGDEIVMVTDENDVTDYYFANESDNQRQTITNLTLKISGLGNTSMTIPMSMQSGETGYVYNGTDVGEVTFGISSNKAVTIPAFNETFEDGRGAGVASSISRLGNENGDGYLMFIPEEAELTFEIDWDQLDTIKEAAETEIETTFTSQMDFKEGILYQIIINFVGDGITIAIIEAGSWEQQDVYHTFE